MSLNRVVAAARGELGQTEYPPGSNNVKYNTAYYGYEVSGDAWKWCLVFLWWVFHHAGEGSAFFGGGKTASCGTLLRWYQAQGQTVPVRDVQPGDIVILNFSGTQDTQHCGLVVDVQHLQGALLSITTVEGNSTPGLEGSQSNGGSVALKTRHPAQIVAVCRPQYQPEEKADYDGHWAADSIRKAVRKGILNGYGDGTIRPSEPVTRGQLAAILDRLGLLD